MTFKNSLDFFIIMELQATEMMCAVCFDVLIATLSGEATEPLLKAFAEAEPLSSAACPVFVTWKIGPNKALRGCIGTFDNSGCLLRVVPQYALSSALQDSRFPAVTISEVPQLHVSVSLLTNFTPIEDPLDWEIGRHGIEIEFKVGARGYSGTFLPEVSSEQGWDQATTLYNLFKKAGYSPRAQSPVAAVEELRTTLRVVTYQSSKSSLSYANYNARS